MEVSEDRVMYTPSTAIHKCLFVKHCLLRTHHLALLLSMVHNMTQNHASRYEFVNGQTRTLRDAP